MYVPIFLCPAAETTISLHVNTTLLAQSGDWVTVTWENVDSPSSSDWIGVYSPPVNGTIDVKNHAPVKFQVCLCCKQTCKCSCGPIFCERKDCLVAIDTMLLLSMNGDSICHNCTAGRPLVYYEYKD